MLIDRLFRKRLQQVGWAASIRKEVHAWRLLDEPLLLKTRSRKVCMSCHWYRHHAGVNRIPVLAISAFWQLCQRRQSLEAGAV